ncbi:TetR/AcrR family transcriptional regulator [Pseudonocardia sp. TRM90224]|uniref:TetR/AcrR family transcriptional regulator n=1 Tax=Pseudonocardia sp. TRM90224 TaxID=2812678 RepID=UPI001E54FEDE|nr:TetR/AcrR family transcriptional regulator [Pseudonocardia sp. TRM90224]
MTDVVDRPPGPRERQRRRTREEILDVALAVIGELGAGALNMSEVARRVGLRQPSLYQYFDSRLAIYDALFERGMNQHLELVRAAVAANAPGLPALRAIITASITFTVEDPALTQLLFFPAVPGFEPSERAYRPSLEVQEVIASAVAAAIDRCELHPAAGTERGTSLLVALSAGISSLQLGNDQHARPGEARFAPLAAPALEMFEAYFSPEKPAGWRP